MTVSTAARGTAAVSGALPRIPSVPELDGLPDGAFVAAVTPLFEGAPRFLRRLATLRPFGDAATMFARAESLALELPEEEALELVDAHPRLGAPPQTVSALSFAEQGFDRDAAERLAADAEAARARVADELARLNDQYERRFGFRYCVFVAGRPREALLPGFRAALEADRAAELRRALVDVVRIAEDRYRKLQPAPEP
ncbi:MAG TPA: 2-oxo-4-hydroxy-4-carboxy-5-ureidoimidazoline decarboxylase [Candidatus Limnocylindrales bacterium]|nr:2-oxo-4-hydroxy-4-carboxy-5-ureidoimidazoline decarboxylase [Candidatus Limnocylindrales bacterium]